MKFLVAMCVMAVGVSAQYGDLATNHNNLLRQRRSLSQVLLAGSSGVIFKDGQLKHLSPGTHMVHSGPGGTVFSDGGNIQHKRNKRQAIVGDSAIITPDGKMIQLPHGVTVRLAGPSAVQLSNGDTIQYKH